MLPTAAGQRAWGKELLKRKAASAGEVVPTSREAAAVPEVVVVEDGDSGSPKKARAASPALNEDAIRSLYDMEEPTPSQQAEEEEASELGYGDDAGAAPPAGSEGDAGAAEALVEPPSQQAAVSTQAAMEDEGEGVAAAAVPVLQEGGDEPVFASEAAGSEVDMATLEYTPPDTVNLVNTAVLNLVPAYVAVNAAAAPAPAPPAPPAYAAPPTPPTQPLYDNSDVAPLADGPAAFTFTPALTDLPSAFPVRAAHAPVEEGTEEEEDGEPSPADGGDVSAEEEEEEEGSAAVGEEEEAAAAAFPVPVGVKPAGPGPFLINAVVFILCLALLLALVKQLFFVEAGEELEHEL